MTLYPRTIGGLPVRTADGTPLAAASPDSTFRWTIDPSRAPTGRRWRSIRTVLNAGGADLSRVEDARVLRARAHRRDGARPQPDARVRLRRGLREQRRDRPGDAHRAAPRGRGRCTGGRRLDLSRAPRAGARHARHGARSANARVRRQRERRRPSRRPRRLADRRRPDRGRHAHAGARRRDLPCAAGAHLAHRRPPDDVHGAQQPAGRGGHRPGRHAQPAREPDRRGRAPPPLRRRPQRPEHLRAWPRRRRELPGHADREHRRAGDAGRAEVLGAGAGAVPRAERLDGGLQSAARARAAPDDGVRPRRARDRVHDDRARAAATGRRAVAAPHRPRASSASRATRSAPPRAASSRASIGTQDSTLQVPYQPPPGVDAIRRTSAARGSRRRRSRSTSARCGCRPAPRVDRSASTSAPRRTSASRRAPRTS